MEVAREEVSDRCSMIVLDDADEALALLNDTEYGLSAAIHTTRLAAAERLAPGRTPAWWR